ncbi:MAG: RDD family protein [Paracoccaceae bacterium]
MTHLPDPHTQPQFYESVPTKRLIAWVIDVFIVFAFCLVLGLLTVTVAFWIFPLVFVLVSFAYRVITITNRSATWGMRLMNIELRRGDGTRFDFSTAVLHTLGFAVSFSIFLLQIISMVFMVASERGQGLSDMVLGTTAINRRSGL